MKGWAKRSVITECVAIRCVLFGFSRNASGQNQVLSARTRTHTRPLKRRATERHTCTYVYRTSKNTSITLSVNTHIGNISTPYIKTPLKLETNIRKKQTLFSNAKKKK